MSHANTWQQSSLRHLNHIQTVILGVCHGEVNTFLYSFLIDMKAVFIHSDIYKSQYIKSKLQNKCIVKALKSNVFLGFQDLSLWVLFYCENCLICKSSCDLPIFLDFLTHIRWMSCVQSGKGLQSVYALSSTHP